MEVQKSCSCRTDLRFLINTLFNLSCLAKERCITGIVHVKSADLPTNTRARTHKHTLFERTTLISKNVRGCD